MRYSILFALFLLTNNLFAQLDSVSINRVYAFLDKEEFLQSKKILDSLFLIEPENASLLNAYGNHYRAIEKLDSAIYYFGLAEKADSNYNSPILNLAAVYALKKEYVLSLDYGQRYLAREKDIMAMGLMADVYVQLEMPDSALMYYNRILRVDSTRANAYFSKANIYWFNYSDQGRAYYNVTKSIELDTTVNYYYALRGQILLDDYPFEASRDFDKAISHGDTSLKNYVYRAWANTQIEQFDKAARDMLRFEQGRKFVYWSILIKAQTSFLKSKYDSCIKHCNDVLVIYPEDILVQALKIRSYVYSGKLDIAERTLRHLLEDNKKPAFRLLKLQASIQLLMKTSQNQLKWKNKAVYFKRFSAKKYKKVLKIAGKKGMGYDTLLDRFEKDYRDLELQEYFMLYFGYSQTVDYSAFELTKMQEQTLYDAIREGRYQECIDVGKETLKKNPTQFPLYLPIGRAAWLLGDYETAKEFIYKSEAFFNAILATGSGNITDEAIIVISASHEYALLKYLELGSQGQSLLQEKKHSYDRLAIIDRAHRRSEKFFLIDKVFESYGKMFKEK